MVATAVGTVADMSVGTDMFSDGIDSGTGGTLGAGSVSVLFCAGGATSNTVFEGIGIDTFFLFFIGADKDAGIAGSFAIWFHLASQQMLALQQLLVSRPVLT
jgi:hypothetical protein